MPCDIQISLITCGPGEELYSLFGHTALRVKDPAKGLDIIYNYGTFDFEDPDFYVKFTRGKLLYFVSTEKFSNFLYQYQYENRSVTEQILNLSCEEKHRLFSSLQKNAREENKYYQYDFIFDNCSTRPRDIVARNANTLRFQEFLPTQHPSFRNLLHEYLDKGNQPWSKFGIDMVLGARVDREVSTAESMFLPDYLMKGFDNAIVGRNKLVLEKKTILEQSAPAPSASFLSPATLFSGLFIIVALLSFFKSGFSQRFLKVFDISLFLILGLVGCFLLFMWVGTDHQLCGNNFNLLWALPSHLIIVWKRNQKYFLFSTILYAVLLVSWYFIPQGMNIAILPIILTAGIRSYFLSKN